MRFRPEGGMQNHPNSPKNDRASQEARAAAESDSGENVFNTRRYQSEIEASEAKAQGQEPVVPSGVPGAAESVPTEVPNPETEAASLPAESSEKPADNKPQTLLESIKSAARRMVEKVARLLRPKKPSGKEIIINSESLEIRVAVLQDGRLDEFTIERTNEERLVGSIFKGRVRNLEDGLKAAFVDIGFERNAFLHYWDIVPSQFDSNVEIVEREGRKRDRPKITQKDVPRLYPAGSEIIVQVTKGPIGTKGPRITTNLSLPGRYLVLLPNSDQSGISRKIENPEERARLKRILRELSIPEGMGVVMRTAGEGKQARYFVRDLALLLDEWRSIQERIQKQPAASCVFEEPDLVARTVRDFLTEDVDRILVDEFRQYERIKEMIGRISRRSMSKVKAYNEPQPIFDRFNITKQLETTFQRTVHLKSGGYIVIDETEALVAIDVNTGKHKSGKDLDSTILQVNLEAADEIARQLRLRNIGGLIILDFIDMRHPKDQRAVFNRLRDGLRRDKAKTHLLPISPLGLLEMTRQRQTESVQSSVYDSCPYCRGRGRVKSAETMSVEIQRKLVEILKRRPRDESDFQLRIVVHPTVYDRLRREDEKFIIELEKKFFGRISFRPDPGIHAEHFKILNAVSNEELAGNGS
ncbi:MAG: Rne/Rng family ribonuclease [Verrucomicrobiales bacterium]|nr:Rne/Rng family ribonuclease [Verrucomicrobiales bacterium]